MKRKLRFLIQTNIVIFFLYFISIFNVFAQLNGTYTINPSSSASATNYLTFASAFSDLNSGTRADGGTPNGPGVSGAVVINIPAGYTETFTTSTAGLISATGTSAYTITFQKSGSGSNPVITSLAGQTGTSNYIIELQNNSYITFNDINLQAADTTVQYGYYLVGSSSVGCQHNTIENSTVIMANSVFMTYTYGIYMTSAATSAGGENSYNYFYNNNIQDVYYGIYLYGQNSSSSAYFDLANQITGNTISNINVPARITNGLACGIYYFSQASLTVANNTISNPAQISADLAGIWGYGNSSGGGALTTTINIYGNNISNLKTWGSVAAIVAYNNNSNSDIITNVYNNTINTLEGHGEYNLGYVPSLSYYHYGGDVIGIYVMTDIGAVYGNTITGFQISGEFGIYYYNSPSPGTPPSTTTPSSTLTNFIYNNTISNFSSGGSGGGMHCAGVYWYNGNNGNFPAINKVYDNRVSKIYSTADTDFAIFYEQANNEANVPRDTFCNNVIDTLGVNPSGWTETSGTWTYGMFINTSTYAAPAIYGNTISNLTTTAWASTIKCAGLWLNGCVTSPLTYADVHNNRIYNISSIEGIAGANGGLAGIEIPVSIPVKIYCNKICNVISKMVGASESTYGINFPNTSYSPKIYNDTITNITITSYTSPGENLGGTYGILTEVYGGSARICGNIIDNVYTPSTPNGGGSCGISFYGVGTATAPDSIYNNTITNLSDAGAGGVIGIFDGSEYDHSMIFNNTIHNFIESSTSQSGVRGIYTFAGASLIYNNKIDSIYSLCTSSNGYVHGIDATSAEFVAIFNNYIWGIRGDGLSSGGLTSGNPSCLAGIYAITNDPSYIYYNSIYLDGTATSSSHLSACVFTGGNIIYLENNILYNNYNESSGGIAAALIDNTTDYSNLGSGGSYVNNNDYYAPNSNGLLFYNRTSSFTNSQLSNYQSAASPRDANTISADPSFANISGAYNTFNLNLTSSSPCYNTGMIPTPNPIWSTSVNSGYTYIKVDINSNPRAGTIGYTGPATKPTIGAYEVNSCDLSITIQPAANYNVDENGNVSIGLTAVNAANYQWQESTDGGVTFANLTDGGVYSGSATNTLTLTNVPVTMSGNVYQCILTLAGGGCSTTSHSSTITVINGSPNIVTDVVNDTACSETSANFSVLVDGTSPFTYQWMENGVDISNGGIYSGATTSTLTLMGVTYPMNGYLYQCMITNSYGYNYSGAAQLTVNLICNIPDTSGDSLETISLSQIGPGPYNVEWDGLILPTRDSLENYFATNPGIDSLTVDTIVYHQLDSLRSDLSSILAPGIHFVKEKDAVGDSELLEISVGEKIGWTNSSGVFYSTATIPNLINSDTTHVYGQGITVTKQASASYGSYPYYNSFIQANNNLLYGMTSNGGAYGQGTIFSYNSLTGNNYDVHDFSGIDDGSQPNSSLIQASNGLLYGMTTGGGIFGGGTIFSYNILTGIEVDLHDFSGTDGDQPLGCSLIQASNGLLYGMTTWGGANGGGIIFSYNISTGVETDLHDFASGSDGFSPQGSLIQASDGLLYGSTSQGGLNGTGMVFNYNISTGTETDIYDFNPWDYDDGFQPYGALIQANNGLLYGLTMSGGVYWAGTIFSYNISTNMETDLHDFGTNSPDGAYPYGSIMQASNGLIYGMTANGGVYGGGIIFSYNISSATETDIHDFGSGFDGTYPYGNSLIQANNGLLYGLTTTGGANGSGTILSYNISTSTETDIDDLSGWLTGSWSDGYAYTTNLLASNQTGSVEFTIENASNQEAVGLVFADTLAVPDSSQTAQNYYMGSQAVPCSAVGFTHGTAGYTPQAGYSDMEYAFMMNANTLSIIESGTTVLSTSFNSGDVLGMRIEPNLSGQYYLDYFQNDQMIHSTLLSTPIQFLVKDAIFTGEGDINATVINAMLLRPALAEQINDATCDQPNSGYITVYVTGVPILMGGTPPSYTYSWTNTTIGGPAPQGSTTATITDVIPNDTYKVNVSGGGISLSGTYSIANSTTWQNMINVSAGGQNDCNLEKSSNTNGANAGASSANLLMPQTSGWTEFTIGNMSSIGKHIFYGLSFSSTDLYDMFMDVEYGVDVEYLGKNTYAVYSVYESPGWTIGTYNLIKSAAYKLLSLKVARQVTGGSGAINLYANSTINLNVSYPISPAYSLETDGAIYEYNDYIKNSRSSYGCWTKQAFATLNRTLDGDYYIMHDTLKFKFDEEYNNPTADLSFNIYNQTNTLPIETNSTVTPTVIGASFGEDYFSIPMTSLPYVIDGNYYTLEVLSPKGERWFLRFYKD